jgi:hypothetical protein
MTGGDWEDWSGEIASSSLHTVRVLYVPPHSGTNTMSPFIEVKTSDELKQLPYKGLND